MSVKNKIVVAKYIGLDIQQLREKQRDINRKISQEKKEKQKKYLTYEREVIEKYIKNYEALNKFKK